MSAAVPPDLIDRIAGALPAELRADYYLELRHCRSLPENDEMLRILRIMQFLTLLMEQVPQKVGVERERLERIVAAAVESCDQARQSSDAYHHELDRRLNSLPGEIARGISPEAIAATINENLRQQFVRSTIPETAQVLAVVSAQMKQTTEEFAAASGALVGKYHGAAEDARRSINEIRSSVSAAAATAQTAAQQLSKSFHLEYRWSLYSLTTGGIFVGLALGALLDHWVFR
jgi:hypothetical protein